MRRSSQCLRSTRRSARSRGGSSKARRGDDVAARMKERGYTLRWIAVHMIEETARRSGHADIMRELLDGKTGG